MIPNEFIAGIQERFQLITGPVKLDFFHQLETQLQIPGRSPCPTCPPALAIVEQLAGLHEQIELRLHDIHSDKAAVAKWAAERIPCLVIHGEINRPVRYYGLPAGIFLPVLVDMIVACSNPPTTPPQELAATIKKLRDRVNVRVLGSQQHPGSGRAAATAFSLALLSDKVSSSVYAIENHPDLALQLQLSRIPLTLVNGVRGFGGVTTVPGLAQFCLDMQTRPDDAPSPAIEPGTMIEIQPPKPPPPPQKRGGGPPGQRRTRGGIILPGG